MFVSRPCSSRRLHGRRGLKWLLAGCALLRCRVAAFTGGVDRNTAVGDYKRNVPVTAFTSGMD
jgi:hypothetical protein